MRNADTDDMANGQAEPHYTQGTTKGLYAYVYVNGDQHCLPKKLLVNPKRDRNYNAFLDYATKVLNPRYGAVRNIMTPDGRHRVRGFDDLQPDGRYVACGREPYKRLKKPYVYLLFLFFLFNFLIYIDLYNYGFSHFHRSAMTFRHYIVIFLKHTHNNVSVYSLIILCMYTFNIIFLEIESD